MDEETQKIGILAEQLEIIVANFQRLLVDTPIINEMSEAFDDFNLNMSSLSKAFKQDGIDSILHHAQIVVYHAEKIINHSKRLSDANLKKVKSALSGKTVELKTALRLKVEASKLPDEADFNIRNLHSYEQLKKLKSIIEEHERHDQRVKKLLNENEHRIAALEQKINELEEEAQIEIDNITLAYSEGAYEIEQKKAEIDAILGHVSGRAVAGDYAKSAAEEKEMADWLRVGSLACMAVIAASLIYSLFETIHSDFNWQQSIFRITLTFLLSVPAAYLARESAKHREQQYQHLQTSLDLKAISPFTASLPDEEQHKIKIAIASKIFAGRDFSKVGTDPYPINTQEIIMELLKKVDVSKAKPQKASE